MLDSVKVDMKAEQAKEKAKKRQTVTQGLNDNEVIIAPAESAQIFEQIQKDQNDKVISGGYLMDVDQFEDEEGFPERLETKEEAHPNNFDKLQLQGEEDSPPYDKKQFKNDINFGLLKKGVTIIQTNDVD